MTNTKIMSTIHRWAALLALFGALGSGPSLAQATFSEDFTGANTVNSWYFFSGACLTAGTSVATGNPGPIPACTSVLPSYYELASSADPYLVGGYLGYLGSASAPSGVSSQVPDPVGSGALRFTNGSVNIGGSYKYGFNERGAILSSNTFPTGSGIQVTFKTITYHGNAGGSGGDGADGISFFLQDGSQPPGLGAFGGSLAYSCSNSNTPHDGLVAGYIGLGIDEYGNFLNGTNLVSTYTGTNTATGDNTAYGYGFKPGRIGLARRGQCILEVTQRGVRHEPRKLGPAVLSAVVVDLLRECGRRVQLGHPKLHRHLLRRFHLRPRDQRVQQGLHRWRHL